MKRIRRVSVSLTLSACVALAACGDSAAPEAGGNEAGMSDPGPSDDGDVGDPGDGSGDGPPGGDDPDPGDDSSGDAGQRFRLTIENISGNSALPGPFAPGALAVHTGNSPLFVPGQPDEGLGLETLAEDGGGAALAAAVGGLSFGTPVGATEPRPIFPGERYEIVFNADDRQDALSFASRLGQSNDLFITNGARGIALFETDGTPRSGDITELVELWDAGTEVNQAPGFGPDQSPRQAGPNQGAPEGVISLFNGPTRALPNASQLATITVVDTGASFTVTLENSSEAARAPMPIGEVFYAAHNQSWSLFTEEQNASPGLEALAEDGLALTLTDEHDGAPGTTSVGAQRIVDGESEPGMAMPGQRQIFTVTPTPEFPYVTFAAMAVRSNDVFIAPSAAGIRFIDESGARRAVADIEKEIRAQLDLWDAGTETNQVPGLGRDQPPAAGGPIDPIPGVRRYRDSTNDLTDGARLVDISIFQNPSAGSIFRRLSISNNTRTQLVGSPRDLSSINVVYHNGEFNFFRPDEAVSTGMERVAEDGDISALEGELVDVDSVSESDLTVFVLPRTLGLGLPFESEVFTSARFVSFATRIEPSNDLFVATATPVALSDEGGELRPADVIEREFQESLRIYDAGTEANEPGGIGPNQTPVGMPNTGPSEGDGTVRPYDDFWGIPDLDALVRVTITPVE